MTVFPESTTSGIAAGYRALREGCALVDRTGVDRLEILGADRLRFLNAYVTCEVKTLAAGQGAYGFLTSPQGRILADLGVLAHGDRLWLELPPGTGGEVAKHLRKYILADRVEIRPLDDMLPVRLIGPRAAAVLAAAGAGLPEGEWSHLRTKVHGTEVTLQRSGRLGEEAFTLWVSASIAGPVVEDLLAGPEVTPAGAEALEVLRTEAGIPRFGRDFGPENFPQETGAEAAAVSYTKGCYLGQEVVARIHYRGAVQKTLCGLVFDVSEGDPAPAPGTPLLHDGREAGKATTVVSSPALGRTIGLAILHRRAAEPGTRLETADAEGGGGAEVRALPMV
jgi:folate-binding protein YgfZ